MNQQRILVVDDEQDLCDILLFNLQTAGYEVMAAYSAESALQLLNNEEHHYNLLLLDVMMPGMSGFELAAQLKKTESTAQMPIIFLTAKDTESDLLQGFEIGADDYVTKPFSVREVLARVKAVLNRSSHQTVLQKEILQYRGLEIDVVSKRVTIDGEEVPLTKTELEVLMLLLSHRGQVLSRQKLLEGAWPKDVIVTDRTVDVNITRLRKKLGNYASNIVARQGYGYCFEV